MRIVIFEPGEGGHRLQYIASMLPGLAGLADVTIGLREDVPQMKDFEIFLGNLDQYGGRVTIDASVPAGHPFHWKTQWNRVGALRKIVAKADAQRIYIPSADGFAQILGAGHLIGRRGFPRAVPAEALILRGGFAYLNQQGWRQTLKARVTWWLGAAAPFSLVHLLDPVVYERVLRDPAAGSRYRLMPDPVERPQTTDRIAARMALGLPLEGRIVGCAGFIDVRKGIDLLMRAVRSTPGLANDKVLLAGKHFTAVYDFLKGEFAPMVDSGQIISIDRLLTPHEVGLAVAAMDLVCTPYRYHIGSASILIRASVAGRPVLAQNFGWMQYVVNRFKLGETCDVFDPISFGRAIEAGLDRAEQFSLTEAGRRFAEFHSVDNFCAHWAVELRRQLGLPPDPALRSWEWVNQAVEVETHRPH
jgi:glycosyltransferase involved in cell wall biosynthesis